MSMFKAATREQLKLRMALDGPSGDKKSGWILMDDRTPVAFGKDCNKAILNEIAETDADIMVIEYMAAMGMPTAQQVLDAQFWAGRFVQEFGGEWKGILRREVKLAICGQARAKDANIRQAIIDQYGGKDTAIGKKANPGPLYGIANDVWSALAVGLTFLQTKSGKETQC